MAAKPWEELHTQISTNDEYKKMIAYKGLTCTCSSPSLFFRSFPFSFLSRVPRQVERLTRAGGGRGECRYGGARRVVRTIDCSGANAKEAAVGHGRREEVSSPGEHPNSEQGVEATDPPGSGHSSAGPQHISTPCADCLHNPRD